MSKAIKSGVIEKNDSMIMADQNLGFILHSWHESCDYNEVLRIHNI